MYALLFSLSLSIASAQDIEASEAAETTNTEKEENLLSEAQHIKASLVLKVEKREEVANAMIQAAEEIIDGKFMSEFITDVIQGGAGTSMNMNM